jgi:phosphoribosylformylglycinamidine synthase
METYECLINPVALPEVLLSHPWSSQLQAYDVLSYRGLEASQIEKLKCLFPQAQSLETLEDISLLARQHHSALIHPREQSLGSFLACQPSLLRLEQWIVCPSLAQAQDLERLLQFQWREPAIENLWSGTLGVWKDLRLPVRKVERPRDPSWDEVVDPADIGLEFSEDELKVIRKKESERGRRLNRTEWELLAQTWSEHCKHKIFAARIEAPGAASTITEGLFQTHLRAPALEIQKNKSSTYLSLFHDNSGVLGLRNAKGEDSDWAFCIKMETHNSPSAISPYGGASTGLVGVHRDILGTGLGAKPIASWNVLCFEEPDHTFSRPSKALPPDVVRKGVLKGIEDGGNQSGIPTVQGSVVFHPSYAAKPLVYAGTLGVLKRSHVQKHPLKGDTIYCVGGAVGPDGLRGAVMSSRDLRSEDFSGSAVQVAQPFVQRCLTEFLLEARNLGLITSVTDNGAGGLASSVGEMAQSTGGARIDLSHVRLKFEGLYAWERLLSESQERMTVATRDPEAFEKLAKEWDLAIDRLGELSDSGFFEVSCFGKTLLNLELKFLHDSCPRMHLKSDWTWGKEQEVLKAEAEAAPSSTLVSIDPLKVFPQMLESVHLCSREGIVRRLDHEVQGRTRRLPFAGASEESPQDGSLMEITETEDTYVALGHGLAPWRRDIHDNVLHSLDESLRQALLAGIRLGEAGFLDNFSWPDPLPSARRPQSSRLLWRLLRSCEILSRATRTLGIPFVSGKDSMKNNTEAFDVLETLVISVAGAARSPLKTPSSFFTRANDVVFYLPPLKSSLRGSLLERFLGQGALTKDYALLEASDISTLENEIQKLLESMKARYEQIENAVDRGLLRAAKDIGEGGLFTSVFEMCLGRFLGVQFEAPHPSVESLYSEGLSGFVFTCDVHVIEELEALFPELRRVGVVIKAPQLRFSESQFLALDDLRCAYRRKGEYSFWF